LDFFAPRMLHSHTGDHSREERENVMKKLSYLLISVALLLLAFGPVHAGETSPDSNETLKYVGCGVIKKSFMQEMAEAYRLKTGIRIIIHGGGATAGIRSALAGRSDFGGTCRHLLKEEEQQNGNLVKVAYDALVFIVNPSNPVSDLTRVQLIKIFTGKIRNWKTVGARDKAIIIVSRRSPISGVGLMFREMFLPKGSDYARKRIELLSSSEVEKEVENNPYAIAVTGIASARVRKVKILKVQGILPNLDSIRSGEYPYYRPLYFVTHGTPNQQVKRFIDFVLSPEGQTIVRRNAFTIQDIEGPR